MQQAGPPVVCSYDTDYSVSLFENRSDGENFNQVGMDWVQKNLGSLLPSKPKVTAGEVRIHATAAALVP